MNEVIQETSDIVNKYPVQFVSPYDTIRPLWILGGIWSECEKSDRKTQCGQALAEVLSRFFLKEN